jgi:hypothetical protein
VACDLSDLANGESVTFTIVLAPVTGGQISSKVGATSDQSVTNTLDSWEFLLDLSGPDSDLTPASALLESVVGSSNNIPGRKCATWPGVDRSRVDLGQ